jgi:CDP-diacylglycerol--serine O-phosphatidyltransferase
MFLGFYDYTVILTYLSLLSAGLGIFVSLHGEGHPYLGIFFLMFCGLCDAFDGKVARTKKDRKDAEIKFGIQIDSLTDLVAFGVLPACIGDALIRRSEFIPDLPKTPNASKFENSLCVLLFTLMLLYMLAAMIRLAYFNVEEEERQKCEDGVRKFYCGVPVTSASLVFPTVMLFQYILPVDITMVYFAFMIVLGFAFLSKIQIKKPGFKGIMVMVGIGIVEFIILFIAWQFFQR